MNDIEHNTRQAPTIGTAGGEGSQKRQPQHPRISPNPDAQTSATGGGNPLAALDVQQSVPTHQKSNTAPLPKLSSATKTQSLTGKPSAGNSNSLPGHQSGRTKTPGYHLEQQALNSAENLHSSGASGDQDANMFSPSSLSRKKNLSTSDLDPMERKKQAALAKVEAKLEKAQRLRNQAHQNVEQEISDFLRATAIPNSNVEGNATRTTNASFDKRIRTLQDTKKELEKKIAGYQTDILRIQAGEIPHNYSSSKDILSNIKSTAAKVAGGSLKYRTSQPSEHGSGGSAPMTPDQVTNSHNTEPEGYHYNQNPFTTITAPTPTATPTSAAVNNNQNVLPSNLYSGNYDPTYAPASNLVSNEVGNSQFYIDSTHEHVYDGDKPSRKHDANVPVDNANAYDTERSPTRIRRQTDESNSELNDRASDLSGDDRHVGSTSKRTTPSTSAEGQQLNARLETMQKLVDRYETRINDMQRQIDVLSVSNDAQREHNELLTQQLLELHHTELPSMKTDLKNLEERLLYKFNEYWNELVEKLDKLDTRTAKVEQTQTHSLETEENTHRIISKLVNILLTVFAIILLLLSTIKNLVQSRVHAMTLLILAVAWVTFHYLPPNYFHASFLKNFPNVFKRTARNFTSE